MRITIFLSLLFLVFEIPYHHFLLLRYRQEISGNKNLNVH